MPSRLKPTNPVADSAILVGDPGRALMLAQELLVNPLMSNHARGLWGYSAKTPEGMPLTIQSTGMGGPSAAIVLADLARLGLRRAIRLGTCEALTSQHPPGTTVTVERVETTDGVSLSIGGATESRPRRLYPDPELSGQLAEAGPSVVLQSGDLSQLIRQRLGFAPPELEVAESPVADLQSGALLSVAASLDIEIAVLLVVERSPDPLHAAEHEQTGAWQTADPETLEAQFKQAARHALAALAKPQA